MLVSLYTVKVVIKVLGVVDYGVLSAVGGIVFIMSFLSYTITNAAQRYFSFELGKSDSSRLNRIFSSIFLLYFLLAIFVVIVAEVAGIWFLENKMIIPPERMDAAHWVLHLSLMSFLLTILYSPYNAMIIAHENMKIYAYVSIIEALLKLGIVFLLLISPFDKLVFYALLLLFSNGIIVLIYVWYCYRSYPETHLLFFLDKSILRELLGYASWTMFGALAGAANNQGVNLLLNSFYGPAVNTSYSVSNQIGNTLQIFGTNLFNAIRPPMIKKYAAKQYDEVIDLLYKSTKYISFLLLFIMLPLFVEIHFVLTIWLGEIIEYMVDFSRLMMVYIFVLQLNNPLTIVAQAANKVKLYHGFIDSFVLLTLLVSYVILRMGGIAQSVFWTMIGILFVAHFIRLKIVNSIIKFSYASYFKKSVLPFMVVFLLTCIPLFLLYQQMVEGWCRLFFVVALSSTLIVIIGYFFGLDNSEKQTIALYLKKRCKY